VRSSLRAAFASGEKRDEIRVGAGFRDRVQRLECLRERRSSVAIVVSGMGTYPRPTDNSASIRDHQPFFPNSQQSSASPYSNPSLRARASARDDTRLAEQQAAVRLDRVQRQVRTLPVSRCDSVPASGGAVRIPARSG
jgi:hypothetical protein